jgi:S-adenosylmethionine hydrolase
MIALFTDFGTRDAYVAQLKGAIVTINPHAVVLDLNHEVGQFNIPQAAYLLERSARYFPAGSIFVTVIDPGVGSQRHPLLLHTGANKFYVGPDNGLFTWVLAHEGLRAAYLLQQTAYFRAPDISVTFHGRDIFGPVAAHLSLGIPPASFGPRLANIITLPTPQPRVTGRTIAGEILHIDHFGNILTNITPDLLAHVQPGATLSVTLRDTTASLPFCTTYAEAQQDRLICLVSSNEEFEIARVQGSAAAYFSAQVGDGIVLRY